MSRVTTTHVVDADGLDGLRRPRTDLVTEVPAGADRWDQAEGPFHHYRRQLEAVTARADGRYDVVEHTEFRLAIPLWWPVMTPLMRRALASPERRPRRRWWWPREVVPRTTAQLVGALCVVSVLAGYLGVIIGQTISFAAEDFGRSDAAQANTLAAVRIGVLGSLVLIHLADRVGRRPLIIGFASAALALTVVGAAAPSLEALGLAQTLSRGLTTGLLTLLALAATEEVPAGARAFTISLLAVTAALGAGMVVWVLPVADVVDGGWRIVYVVPLVFAPLLWWVAGQIPETRRFTAATTEDAPAPVNWARFALIGGTAFATALYGSPASQLRNEYLRDDLGYSAAAVSLFQVVVSTPAGVSIVLAGLLADRLGRRVVGSVAVAAGALLSAVSYQLDGAPLWITASAGVILAGAAYPALRGYQTELFPTRARARVGGLIDVVGVAGSATGLVLAGYLSTRWDNLGNAIGVLVVAPLVVAVAIFVLFPETARVELEELNPGDPRLGPASPATPGPPPP